MGFEDVIKKLHLVQCGDKTLRYFRMTDLPLKFKNELRQGGMKWPGVAIPVRLATPIRTGALVVSYLRHPYAFEVEERVMPGWDEVAPCRDSSEALNTSPDGGTGGDLSPTSTLRL